MSISDALTGCASPQIGCVTALMIVSRERMRIRFCLLYLVLRIRIRDPGWVKNPDPEWTTRIIWSGMNRNTVVFEFLYILFFIFEILSGVLLGSRVDEVWSVIFEACNKTLGNRSVFFYPAISILLLIRHQNLEHCPKISIIVLLQDSLCQEFLFGTTPPWFREVIYRIRYKKYN